LLGLTWDDVDWLGGALQVRRTLQRVKKSLLDADAFRNVERIGDSQLALVKPKSEDSRRSVEVDARLLAALRSEREHSTGRFVFERETGGPLDPDSVYDVLHAAQDAAGVRRFGLHGLRHLYTSLLLEPTSSSRRRSSGTRRQRPR
jgi:integrase